MIAGMPLCAMDGFEIALPATPENLKVFSCTGVARDAKPGKEMNAEGKKGRKPASGGKAGKNAGKGKEEEAEGSFPHLRVPAGHLLRRPGGPRRGRGHDGPRGAVPGGQAGPRPELFASRVFLMDRNFLGYELITAILDAGGHLIMRVRDGINLPLTENGWLPDGSRLTYLNEPERRRACDRLPLRVAEHNAVLPGSDSEVSETYTIATTLLDHEAADAGTLRTAYTLRWTHHVGDHDRGEQGDCHRGGACHHPLPAFRRTRPGLAGVLGPGSPPGPTRPRQRRSRSRHPRGGRCRPPGARQQPEQPGLLHHHDPDRRHVHAPVPGHRHHQPARLAAAAETAGQAAVHTLVTTGRQRYSARLQIPARLPARLRHQAHAQRTRGNHPVPARRITPDQQEQRQERRKRPAVRGTRARGTAARPGATGQFSMPVTGRCTR